MNFRQKEGTYRRREEGLRRWQSKGFVNRSGYMAEDLLTTRIGEKKSHGRIVCRRQEDKLWRTWFEKKNQGRWSGLTYFSDREI